MRTKLTIYHKGTYNKTLLLFLCHALFAFSLIRADIANAEYIDGPANIRTAPNKKVFVSLENGASVKVQSFDGAWYHIKFDALYPIRKSHDRNAIPKDTLIYDASLNVIGKTLVEVPASYVSVNEGKFKATIEGYTFKSNIHKSDKFNWVIKILLKGPWVNEAFISTLNSSRSFLIASGEVVLSHFDIQSSRDSEDYYAMGIYNFHEGAGVFLFSKVRPTGDKNVFILEHEKTTATSRKTLSFLHLGEQNYIEFNGERFYQIEEGLEEFINKTLLAGEYVDDKSHKFSFEESGVAVWPQRSFLYKVDLDLMMESFGCSSFVLLVSKNVYTRPIERYFFKWKDNSLHIYLDQNCATPPLYILKRDSAKN